MPFDAKLARDLALECSLAYVEPTHKVGNIWFRVRTSDSGLLVAFAGTKCIEDVLDDACAVMVHRAGLGWIHNGFADEWDAVKSTLLKMASPGIPIAFTGHSLGAAHALLASAWFRLCGFTVGPCYTFGCPKVGGAEWAGIYDGLKIPTYRLVYGRDGVTLSPALPGWHHVESAVYLDLSARIVPCRVSGLSWNPFTLFGLLGDHSSLDSYMLALARLASRPQIPAI